MASGDTKTESYLRAAAEGTREDLPTDNCCNTKTQNLILGVANRIMDVEDEVEELKNNPDVVDIVDTYADLQSYDTSTLTDKDIIRVLEDSTHDNKSTYYRWNASTNQFEYIGEAGGGVNVVQTTGTSTTDVMSQNAVTSMVFADAGTNQKIKIGSNTTSSGINGVAIGTYASASTDYSVAIGSSAIAQSDSVVAVGNSANAKGWGSVALGNSAVTNNKSGAVALGSNATCTRAGEVNIGAGNTANGYNSTSYRVLGGVHDPVDAHDAATKGYVDANAGGVKTLTSADYNFPSNNPFVLAPWLLPPGQYIVAPHTDVMPDGNSQTYDASTPYGLLVFTQAMSSGGNYGTFIISGYNLNGYYKVEYNGTPVSGFPHEI